VGEKGWQEAGKEEKSVSTSEPATGGPIPGHESDWVRSLQVAAAKERDWAPSREWLNRTRSTGLLDQPKLALHSANLRSWQR